jgi:hypothetical protein
MQLGICPEAASHLQEFKDNLIAISNELIDNVENLSSVQIAKLRQDRCAFTLKVGIISPVTLSSLYISIIVTFFFYYASLLYLGKKLLQHIHFELNSIWVESKICC